MSKQPKLVVMAQDVELLGISVAKYKGRSRVILTIRPDPTNSFQSVNLAISKQAAARLLHDLQLQFQISSFLNTPEDADAEAEVIRTAPRGYGFYQSEQTQELSPQNKPKRSHKRKNK
jgi:hypothetical protein